MKKTSVFILMFVLLIGLIGCGTKNNEEKQTAFFRSMGTTIKVELYSNDETILTEIEDIFDYYNQLTSNFKRNEFKSGHKYYGLNNIYLINQKAGVEPVEVKDELIEILEYSIELHETTNGYFHLGIGNLVNFWKELIDSYISLTHEVYLQKLAEVELIEVPDIEKIVIDKEAKTVFLADNTVNIDLGALAKGYVLDKAYKLIQTRNIKKFYIDAGKSSLAYGIHPDNRPYRLGINDSESKYENNMLGILEAKNITLSTSGSSEQFLPVKNEEGKVDKTKMIHHIVSPFTKKPENIYYSVTIIHQDGGLADALTTAIYLMEPEEAIAFLNQYNVDYILYDLEYNVLTNLNEEVFTKTKKL